MTLTQEFDEVLYVKSNKRISRELVQDAYDSLDKFMEEHGKTTLEELDSSVAAEFLELKAEIVEEEKSYTEAWRRCDEVVRAFRSRIQGLDSSIREG